MSFFWQGLQDGLQAIWDHDPYLVQLVEVTLRVCLISTAVALVIGLPIGVTIGIGRFRGRGVLQVLANAGLGLPPVVVGLVMVLLLLPVGPLGSLHLLYTLNGVLVAQTILSLPIIVALTSSAVADTSPGLLDQARAFGAGRLAVAVLATREARIGIVAATIASVGSGLSEVGAVVLVGGNIEGSDQTLASAALTRVDAAHYAEAFGIAIILMVLILVLTALFTWLQYGTSRRFRPGLNA